MTFLFSLNYSLWNDEISTNSERFTKTKLINKKTNGKTEIERAGSLIESWVEDVSENLF